MPDTPSLVEELKQELALERLKSTLEKRIDALEREQGELRPSVTRFQGLVVAVSIAVPILTYFGIGEWQNLQTSMKRMATSVHDLGVGLALPGEGPSARPELAILYLRRALASNEGSDWEIRETLLEALFSAYNSADRHSDGITFWESYQSADGVLEFKQLWTNNSLGSLYLGHGLNHRSALDQAFHYLHASEKRFRGRSALSEEEKRARFFTLQNLWIASLAKYGCIEPHDCSAAAYLMALSVDDVPNDFCSNNWFPLLRREHRDLYDLALTQLRNRRPELCPDGCGPPLQDPVQDAAASCMCGP